MMVRCMDDGIDVALAVSSSITKFWTYAAFAIGFGVLKRHPRPSLRRKGEWNVGIRRAWNGSGGVIDHLSCKSGFDLRGHHRRLSEGFSVSHACRARLVDRTLNADQ